jgi:hypothetical protein
MRSSGTPLSRSAHVARSRIAAGKERVVPRSRGVGEEEGADRRGEEGGDPWEPSMLRLRRGMACGRDWR